jgi:hypothetical protein
MRYTLLELTQDILSSLDSEEVNSISDTTESMQVVKVIKTVYDDLQSRANLPIQKTLFNLTASGDSTKPILMTKPTTIDSIEWVRYNKILDGDTDPTWSDIKYLPLDAFVMMTQNLLVSDSTVDTMSQTSNGFTFTFYYKNDRGPSYYTSYNDNTLIFDSYDSEVDTTLQSSKTLCFGELTNVFTESDTWVPNLQPTQFSLLLNEAKALAWAELKQTVHQKAELTARRGWRHLAKTRQSIADPEDLFSNAHPLNQLPNFGRK